MNLMRNLFAKKSDARPVEELIASLASSGYKDHEVRKQAIAALFASGYRDPQDARSYEILASTKALKPGIDTGDGWDQNALKKDIEQFPDFDLAYLRAAYPNRLSDDHAHANEKILLDGLAKSKVKGNILARLSCYHNYYSSHELQTLDYATAAVLFGDPSDGPGSMVQVVVMLAQAFDKVGQGKAANLLKRVKASYDLGPKQADHVSTTVQALVSRHRKEVEWAARLVEKRLAQ